MAFLTDGARRLRQVDAADPVAVLRGLEAALTGGDALLPLQAAGSSLPVPPSSHVDRRVALVVETSGSTGTGKRVALAADALLAGAAAADAALGGAGNWVLALPAHYIAGLNVLTRSIVAGSTPAILPPGRFDPDGFADAVAGLAAPTTDVPRRYTSLVPVQLSRALAHPRAVDALRSLDAVLVGGQATPSALRDQATALGVPIVSTYGASETSGGCVYNGVPFGSVRTELVDGELQLAGPMLAEGYLEDAGRTEQMFVVRDGVRWYRTNDAATIADGVVSVVGRLDDVIVSGGEKVALGAVERVVRADPLLAEAVVAKRPSAEWGEVPVVVSATAVSLDALRARVGAELGRASRPAALIVVEAVPMLATGKPDRRAIASLVANSVESDA